MDVPAVDAVADREPAEEAEPIGQDQNDAGDDSVTAAAEPELPKDLLPIGSTLDIRA